MEVLEHQHDRSRRGKSLEEGPPGPEELLWPGGRWLDPEQGEEGRLDPAPLIGVGDVGCQRLAQLRPGRWRVVGLEQVATFPDHLAKRPEADPIAIRR